MDDALREREWSYGALLISKEHEALWPGLLLRSPAISMLLMRKRMGATLLCVGLWNAEVLLVRCVLPATTWRCFGFVRMLDSCGDRFCRVFWKDPWRMRML